MRTLQSLSFLCCLALNYGFITNDYLSLPSFAKSAFSGAGIPPAMAYKMFDGSISDFTKYKAMKRLAGGITGSANAAVSSSAGILGATTKLSPLGGTGSLMTKHANSIQTGMAGSKRMRLNQMIYLCSETPDIYKLQQCSAVQKCMHPLTVCVQSSLFTGCCAKDLPSLRLID